MVPSVVSLEATFINTRELGWESRTMVNSAVLPASVVVKPGAEVTVIPEFSSSVMVAVTCSVPNSKPLETLSISTTMASSPSTIESSTVVRVISALSCPAGMVMELGTV